MTTPPHYHPIGGHLFMAQLNFGIRVIYIP